MDDTACKDKSDESHFCDICSLEYLTKNDLEEHTWSLLHHKKLDKEKGRDYIHKCTLCDEDIFGLLSFTKHIHGDDHQKKLQEWKTNIAGPTPVEAMTEDDDVALWKNPNKQFQNWIFHGGYQPRGQRFHRLKYSPPRFFVPNNFGPRYIPRPRGFNHNGHRAASYKFHDYSTPQRRWPHQLQNRFADQSMAIQFNNRPPLQSPNSMRPEGMMTKANKNSSITSNEISLDDSRKVSGNMQIEVLDTSFKGFEATRKMREKIKEINDKSIRNSVQFSSQLSSSQNDTSSRENSWNNLEKDNLRYSRDMVVECPDSFKILSRDTESVDVKDAVIDEEVANRSEKRDQKEGSDDRNKNFECPFVSSKEEEVLASYAVENLWRGAGKNSADASNESNKQENNNNKKDGERMEQRVMAAEGSGSISRGIITTSETCDQLSSKKNRTNQPYVNKELNSKTPSIKSPLNSPLKKAPFFSDSTRNQSTRTATVLEVGEMSSSTLDFTKNNYTVASLNKDERRNTYLSSTTNSESVSKEDDHENRKNHEKTLKSSKNHIMGNKSENENRRNIIILGSDFGSLTSKHVKEIVKDVKSKNKDSTQTKEGRPWRSKTIGSMTDNMDYSMSKSSEKVYPSSNALSRNDLFTNKNEADSRPSTVGHVVTSAVKACLTNSAHQLPMPRTNSSNSSNTTGAHRGAYSRELHRNDEETVSNNRNLGPKSTAVSTVRSANVDVANSAHAAVSKSANVDVAEINAVSTAKSATGHATKSTIAVSAGNVIVNTARSSGVQNSAQHSLFRSDDVTNLLGGSITTQYSKTQQNHLTEPVSSGRNEMVMDPEAPSKFSTNKEQHDQGKDPEVSVIANDQQALGSSNVSLESSILSLDESLKSSNLSNQCEFRYKDGRRCPTSAEHKFCTYHEKVVRDVFIHHARVTALQKSQNESDKQLPNSPGTTPQLMRPASSPIGPDSSANDSASAPQPTIIVSQSTGIVSQTTITISQVERENQPPPTCSKDGMTVTLSDSEDESDLLSLPSRFKYLHKATENPLSGLDLSRTNLPANVRKLLNKHYGGDKKSGGEGDEPNFSGGHTLQGSESVGLTDKVTDVATKEQTSSVRSSVEVPLTTTAMRSDCQAILTNTATTISTTVALTPVRPTATSSGSKISAASVSKNKITDSWNSDKNDATAVTGNINETLEACIQKLIAAQSSTADETHATYMQSPLSSASGSTSCTTAHTTNSSLSNNMTSSSHSNLPIASLGRLISQFSTTSNREQGLRTQVMHTIPKAQEVTEVSDDSVATPLDTSSNSKRGGDKSSKRIEIESGTIDLNRDLENTSISKVQHSDALKVAKTWQADNFKLIDSRDVTNRATSENEQRKKSTVSVTQHIGEFKEKSKALYISSTSELEPSPVDPYDSASNGSRMIVSKTSYEKEKESKSAVNFAQRKSENDKQKKTIQMSDSVVSVAVSIQSQNPVSNDAKVTSTNLARANAVREKSFSDIARKEDIDRDAAQVSSSTFSTTTKNKKDGTGINGPFQTAGNGTSSASLETQAIHRSLLRTFFDNLKKKKENRKEREVNQIGKKRRKSLPTKDHSKPKDDKNMSRKLGKKDDEEEGFNVADRSSKTNQQNKVQENIEEGKSKKRRNGNDYESSKLKRPRIEKGYDKAVKKYNELTKRENETQNEMAIAKSKIQMYMKRMASIEEKLKVWRIKERYFEKTLNRISKHKILIKSQLGVDVQSFPLPKSRQGSAVEHDNVVNLKGQKEKNWKDGIKKDNIRVEDSIRDYLKETNGCRSKKKKKRKHWRDIIGEKNINDKNMNVLDKNHSASVEDDIKIFKPIQTSSFLETDTSMGSGCSEEINLTFSDTGNRSREGNLLSSTPMPPVSVPKKIFSSSEISEYESSLNTSNDLFQFESDDGKVSKKSKHNFRTKKLKLINSHNEIDSSKHKNSYSGSSSDGRRSPRVQLTDIASLMTEQGLKVYKPYQSPITVLKTKLDGKPITESSSNIQRHDKKVHKERLEATRDMAPKFDGDLIENRKEAFHRDIYGKTDVTKATKKTDERQKDSEIEPELETASENVARDGANDNMTPIVDVFVIQEKKTQQRKYDVGKTTDEKSKQEEKGLESSLTTATISTNNSIAQQASFSPMARKAGYSHVEDKDDACSLERTSVNDKTNTAKKTQAAASSADTVKATSTAKEALLVKDSQSIKEALAVGLTPTDETSHGVSNCFDIPERIELDIDIGKNEVGRLPNKRKRIEGDECFPTVYGPVDNKRLRVSSTLNQSMKNDNGDEKLQATAEKITGKSVWQQASARLKSLINESQKNKLNIGSKQNSNSVSNSSLAIGQSDDLKQSTVARDPDKKLDLKQSIVKNRNDSNSIPPLDYSSMLLDDKVYRPHTSAILDLQVFRYLIYSCSSDKRVISHYAKNNMLSLKAQISCKVPIKCIEIHCIDNKPILFAGCLDCQVLYYDLFNLHYLGAVSFSTEVRALHVRFGNLYVGLVDGSVRVVNLKKGGHLKYSNHCMEEPHVIGSKAVRSIKSAIICQDKDNLKRLLVVLLQNAILILDAATLFCIKTFTVNSLCLGVHKKKFYYGLKNGEVHCCNLEELREPELFCNQNGEVMSLKVIGDFLITSSSDCLIRCFSLDSGKLLQVYGGQNYVISSLAVDLTQRLTVYCGNENGEMRSFVVEMKEPTICEWQDCKLPFIVKDHLKMHVLNHHVQNLTDDRRCRWKSCTHSYATVLSQKDIQDNVGHVIGHVMDSLAS